MTGWRDDLPPIPSERIRTDAIREGSRRRERRAKRQRAVLYGGVGTAVVALIVVIAVQSERPPEQAGDDAAAEATVAPATAAAPATTAESSEESAPATTAPAAPATEAPATTFSEAPASTAAAATTAPNHTTVPGSIAELPVSGDVIVTRSVIWEQPLTGANCGLTTSVVQLRVPNVTPGTPVVHWEVAGVRGEAPMEVRGETAIATIGPFPSDTLETDTSHEVLVYVTDAERFGDEIFRAPLVTLRDCSP
jgi:hypothetical protein